MLRVFKVQLVAAAYNNEKSVSMAIKKSNVKREEIFVTTKYLPPFLKKKPLRVFSEGVL